MSRSDVDTVVMTSGGLDSTVLFYWALDNHLSARALFIDYGQHCAGAELASLRKVLPAAAVRDLEIVNCRDIFSRAPSRMIRSTDLWAEKIESEDIILPYRNMFLLCAAAAYASSVGGSRVLSAFINSNHASEIDATSEFLAGASGLIAEVGKVALEMPFKDMSKAQVAALGVSLGVSIGETFSCQVNHAEHCGSCPNCVERLAALESLVGT